MGAMEFDSVVAGCVQVFSCVDKAFLYAVDFFERGGMRLIEIHAHNLAFELDVASGDGVGLNRVGALSTWMADLADD